MNLSLILALLWLVAANVIAMLPSRRNHWPAAYGLTAVGVPLLGYLTYENGPLLGVLALAAGISLLRWPAFYFWRWLRNLGPRPENRTE